MPDFMFSDLEALLHCVRQVCKVSNLEHLYSAVIRTLVKVSDALESSKVIRVNYGVSVQNKKFETFIFS